METGAAGRPARSRNIRIKRAYATAYPHPLRRLHDPSGHLAGFAAGIAPIAQPFVTRAVENL